VTTSTNPPRPPTAPSDAAGDGRFVPSTPDPEWVNHRDAARLLGCSVSTIRRLIDGGEIYRRPLPYSQFVLSRKDVDLVSRRWDRRAIARIFA
jgi:hypothetical protein